MLTLEDIDGGQHSAVDGQSLGEKVKGEISVNRKNFFLSLATFIVT